MPFEPENALERSLMKAATDPAHCPQFYRDLLESDLFILPVDPPSSVKGQVELHEDMELKLR